MSVPGASFSAAKNKEGRDASRNIKKGVANVVIIKELRLIRDIYSCFIIKRKFIIN